MEDEEKEKKKEYKGEKMKSAKTSEDLLRLITAIALLNMAKGESEEEEEGERLRGRGKICGTLDDVGSFCSWNSAADFLLPMALEGRSKMDETEKCSDCACPKSP
jgi:hypothetical protein